MNRFDILVLAAGLSAISFVVGFNLRPNMIPPPPPRPYVEETRIDDREDRIHALIIERNPKATLREFQGFAQTLLAESEKAGIDFKVVLAVIEKESQFNPRAVGSVGEIGLMQIRPELAVEIARAMGWTYVAPVKSKKPGERYESLGSLADPSYNVRMGIIHLRDHIKRFGLTAVAFRAYNRGEKFAKEHREKDRYAEIVALNVVTYLPRFKEGQ